MMAARTRARVASRLSAAVQFVRREPDHPLMAWMSVVNAQPGTVLAPSLVTLAMADWLGRMMTMVVVVVTM